MAARLQAGLILFEIGLYHLKRNRRRKANQTGSSKCELIFVTQDDDLDVVGGALKLEREDMP